MAKNFALDRALDLDHARVHAFKRDLDHARVHAFKRDLDHALKRDHAFDLARDHAFDLARDLDLNLACDLDLALKRARDLDLARDLNLDLARDLDLNFNLARVLNFILIGLINTAISLQNNQKQNREISNEEFIDLAVSNFEELENIDKMDLGKIVIKNTHTEFITTLQTLPKPTAGQCAEIALLRYFLIRKITNNPMEIHLAKLDYLIWQRRSILEFYETLVSSLKSNQDKQNRNLLARLQKSKKENFTYRQNLETSRKCLEAEIGWLQLAIARTQGLIPAWESILLVREQITN